MAEPHELPMHPEQENRTTATNVYSDIWRLERDGQGMFKLTQAEIEALAELAGAFDSERTFTIEVSQPDDDGKRVFDVTDEEGRSILASEVHLQPGASLEAELNVKGATEGSVDVGENDG